MKPHAGINEIEELTEKCTLKGGDPARIKVLLESFEFSPKTILIAMGMVLHSAENSLEMENMLRCKHLLEQSLKNC